MGRDYDGGNTTGFVSPAGEALEGPIDLSEMLDLAKPHRYTARVLGDGLRERGIFHHDVLVVDAAAPPTAGRVCVAFVQGEVLVAELALRAGAWWLKPSQDRQEPIPLQGEETELWGLVCSLVRPTV